MQACGCGHSRLGNSFFLFSFCAATPPQLMFMFQLRAGAGFGWRMGRYEKRKDLLVRIVK